MRIVNVLVILTLLVLGLTFAILNAEPVTINYYVGKDTLPLSFLLTIAFLTGALVGLLIALVGFFRARRENRQLRKRIDLAEAEVNNLRSIPLKDTH